MKRRPEKKDERRPAVPIRIKVASRTSCLATICGFVEGACKALAPHLTPGTVHDLELAVNEACSNIIRHAYGGDPNQTIWIAVDRQNEYLVFTTIDGGRPADAGLTGTETAEPGPHDLREGGYGVLVIRRVMDVVEYRRDPKRGNVLVMKKAVACPESESKIL